MLLCCCSWINEKGVPSPDSNPAIGMAVCYTPIHFGEKGSIPFPICEEHAKKKGKFWKVLPLPGQETKDWHPIVYRDALDFRIIPDAVSKSIRESFGAEGYNILEDLRFNLDHFYFVRGDLYYGVEMNGHIHT